MRRTTLLLALITIATCATAQTEVPVQRELDKAGLVKDAVQGGWSVSGTYDDAKQEGYLLDSIQPVIQLEQVRSVRNDALAKRKGKLSEDDCEDLKQLAGEVNAASPNSFEGNMANYYAEFPAPAAFGWLEQAKVLEPQRQELIAPELVQAAREDQRPELVRSAKAMKQRGEVAPALYHMAEDILLSVDRNGILIAAGEMDAYPVWVEQYANDDRNDVLTIDQRLLGDAAYRARMWQRAAAEGVVPKSASEFIDGLYTATKRPVFLSLAVGQPLAAKYSAQLYVTGLAMRMSATPAGDPNLLESRWRAMHKPTDAGPLSGNYLVPGTALLNHYRAIGDEERANPLELELRNIAGRTGNTARMYTNGVFEH